nr:hypothetical protein [Candidatus Enterousia merdequi]
MKRIFLTSALAISMAIPSFAETTAPDIAAGAESATCDSGTLNTTDGTSTLSAQWTANTITLNFYGEDTTRPFATNTCTYDGGITLPASAPRRTGYNFAGWQVKQALFDLRTLVDKVDVRGFSFAAKGSDSCDYYNNLTGEGKYICSENIFDDLNYEEWKTEFEYGTVKGVAKCSITSEEYHSIGNPADSGGGQYCWCRLTNFAKTGISNFSNVTPSLWFTIGYLGSIDDDDSNDAEACARACAINCSINVMEDFTLRPIIFGITEQE